VDACDGRSLTDDEAIEYENLEKDLVRAQRTEQIRARQEAYNAPAPGQNVMVAPAKSDDGLERAFENYLRTGIPNQDIAGLRVTGISNAQSGGSDPAGGYMVPSGFRQKLVEVQKAFGGLAAEVDSYSTDTGNPVEFPSLDDTAQSGQITAEGSAVAGGADLTFGTVLLGAFKYTSSGASNAPLKVSVELLQDSAFDVVGLVARKLGERIARKQATDWVNGGGTTLPFGIARSGLTADLVLAAGNAITYAKLLAAETALDPAYEQNAKWAMSKATWQNIRGVVDTTGRPLVNGQDMGIGADGRPARNLLGYPVVIDQAFAANTTLSAMFAVLGDLRESYVIRRVSNLVVIVNPYSSAGAGQVEYTAWERADGNVQNRKAYSLLQANAA
jgi:HK97 family phage major capsid protein